VKAKSPSLYVPKGSSIITFRIPVDRAGRKSDTVLYSPASVQSVILKKCCRIR
jgi:hypothetical protein